MSIVHFDTRSRIVLAKVGYYRLDNIVLGVIRQAIRLQNWFVCLGFDDLDFDITIIRYRFEEISTLFRF